MIRQTVFSISSLLVFSLLFGCKSSCKDMGGWAKPPRPEVLDQLQPLIGSWESSFEIRTAGSEEVIVGSSTHTVLWDIDRRVLIDRMTAELGDGEKMEGLGLWTWDPKRKVFSTWWLDDHGAIDTGTAEYDEKASTWKLKGVSSKAGRVLLTDGSTTFIDENTQRWSFREWIPWWGTRWKLAKVVEFSGTSVRK